jgi:hypothetical protein
MVISLLRSFLEIIFYGVLQTSCPEGAAYCRWSIFFIPAALTGIKNFIDIIGFNIVKSRRDENSKGKIQNSKKSRRDGIIIEMK